MRARKGMPVSPSNSIKQAAYNDSVQMHYWQSAALGSLLRIVAKYRKGCNIHVYDKHNFPVT